MRLGVPQPDTRPPVPVRERRRLAFLGEIGWNGLAGFGGILTYNVVPNFAMDLGAGGSLLGWKAGVRGRWNILTTPLTPYLGIGFNATSGLGQFTDDDRNNSDSAFSSTPNPVTLEVKDSYFMQTVVGIDYTHRRGFTMQLSLGYAKLLNKNNVRIIAGHPRAEQQMAYDIVWKSGAVVSSAFGYAFD
jgi:outer membrane protein W